MKNRKNATFSLLFLISFASCSFQDNSKIDWLKIEEYPYFHISEFELIENQKIWDRSRHNAFTDIIEYNDYVYVVFREASCCHFSHDGAIRIIRSKDLDKWENVAKLEIEDRDLRDPKINICSDNNLCINATGRKILDEENEKYEFQTFVWNSNDGLNWTNEIPIFRNNYWLWRYRWDPLKNRAYGFSYKTGGGRYINLHTSNDGVNFKLENYRILQSGRPNETDLVFLNDSTAISVVRRGLNENSVIGFSRKPFLEWEWSELNKMVAGPNLILLPDKRILAGVRLYDPVRRTSLALIDPVEKRIHEILELPSGGDNGYPGIIIRDGQLLVSYYSSHESHASIYLARIKFD